MILIAHRGNLSGPNPDLENKPEYIQQALNQGYYVEVDVWLMQDDSLMLGHEHPDNHTTLKFLQQDRIVCHAKDPATLHYLVRNNCHCFAHDKDEVVLTSEWWLWTFLDGRITPHSIAVMPERSSEWDISGCLGICTDYVLKAKEKIKNE